MFASGRFARLSLTYTFIHGRLTAHARCIAAEIGAMGWLSLF